MNKIAILLITFLGLISPDLLAQSGDNCANAAPFCTGTTYTFPNNTTTPSLGGGGSYGCLGSTPNPVWYFMQVATSGPIDITINQTSSGGSGIDVDFVCWGPFTSVAAGCAGYNAGNIVDCSYSTASTEYCNIPSAVTGQFYLLLMTNFSGQPGTLSFSQTSGSGSTNCAVLCNMTGLTATPGACNPATNTYTVTGTITTTNPPSTGTLTISSSCGGSTVLTPPFATSIAYSLPGITATGGGCTITASYSADITCSLTQPYTSPAPCSGCTTTAGPAQTVCGGATFNLTTTNAGAGYTYSWTGPGGFTSTAQNPTGVTAPVAAGTYTYNVTATNGGTNCTSFTVITVNAIPVTGVNSPTICAGATATLTGTGATTYAWSTGAGGTSINVTPGSTTTYTVTGTTSGCSSTAVATVTVNPPPVTNVNSPTICAGGTATLTAGGATTYAWSTGAVTNPINVSPAGTTSYTVTGTTAGCSSTAVATVTVAAALVVNVNSPTICAGAVATLTATGGTTYNWSNGAVTNPINVTPATTTSYTVTGTTAGCTGTAVATVTVNPLPVTAVNSATVCDGTTATLTGTGATSYAWSTGAVTNPINVTPSTTTTYTVTGTSLGCSSTAVSTVTVNPIPVTGVNSPSICPGGTATLTGTGATTYAWSTGAVTNPINVTPAGTTSYTVTGTSLGCSSTAVSTVTVNAAMIPNAGMDDTICFGGSTTLMVTPNGAGYTYSWGGAGVAPTNVFNPTATPVSTTDYTVTVTDPSGCVGTDIVQVYVDPQITLAIAGIASTCNSACNGQTIVIPAGGTPTYTYSWSSGCTNASCNSMCVGNYTVTVTDALGCSATDTTNVVEPTPLAFVMSSTTSHCNLPDGSATVTASGGAGGYNYLWPDGQTTATATNLVPGNYCVTVTDANGCTDTACVTVPNAPGVIASITAQTPTSCNGICDGTATAAGAGGVPGYSFSWNTIPVQTTATATGLCAGTYICTVTDASGCFDTASVIIIEPTLVVTAPIANVTICDGASTTLTASASGGNTGAYTYTWTPGPLAGATQTVTPATTTVYTVNVTDINGCPAAPVTVTVTVNPPLTVAAAGTASLCPGASTTITAAAANGNGGPYTYSWMPGGMTGSSVSVTPGSTTTYTVTASDGCSPNITDSVVVTILPLPAVVFNSNVTSGCVPLCVNFTDLSTVAGGGTVASVAWDFGDGNTGTGAAVSNCYMTDGVYSVTATVTSGSGCVSTFTNTNMITVHPIPVAIAAGPPSVSILDPVVQFLDNSIGAATWTWDFGDTLSTSNTSNVQEPSHYYNEVGNYCATLIVTSAFGCADTTTVCVVIDPEFTFFIPNAFSPNGDGVNDEFYGKGDFILEFEMAIFDRWGNMIFFADDINTHWTGKANHGSDMAQEDVYVYTVKLKDNLGRNHKYIGTVTLVK